MLVHHQPGADAEHGELDELPGEARETGEEPTHAGGPELLAQGGIVRLGPALRHGGQHAERRHHVGVAYRTVDIAPGAPRLRLCFLGGLARQPLVQDRKHEHGKRTGQRHDAEHRMEKENDEQEERQPRRIEERDQPGAAEERAHGVHVAQPVQVARAAEPGRLREQPIEHARPERAIERRARHAQQPRANHVEERHDDERCHAADREIDERLLAAARQHPIEHLQHVDGRHEQKRIDREAEEPREHEERLKPGNQLAHATAYSSARAQRRR